ncbi:MAG: VWA domain-containing protein, partial [Oscillospiraceae bacterium]|nr:VWA domain-containing protein [Oscillospiraceae bacterium]
MRGKMFRSKACMRVICMLLSMLMLSSFFVAAFEAEEPEASGDAPLICSCSAADSPEQEAATPNGLTGSGCCELCEYCINCACFVPMGLMEAFSELVYGNIVPGSLVTDRDTSIPSFSNAIINGVGAEDGRIWTNKSVNVGSANIFDMAGGVVDIVSASNDDDFLITLSALSQSFQVQDIIVEPTDTVFVIDVSGSMVSNTVPGDGRTRIAVLIDVLNQAITNLMEADGQNRVSVVIFGGQTVNNKNYARLQTILELAHYTPPANGRFFTVSSSTVTVNSAIPTQYRTFKVEGGTPTQLGIRGGGDILMQNTDTTVEVAVTDGTRTITRRPNIILMTDGDATYGWVDYRNAGLNSLSNNTTFSYDIGNGSAADMSLSLLNVLTASYVKQQIQARYFGTDASRAVGFYTIGFGVDTIYSRALLNPFGLTAAGYTNASLVSQVYNSVDYNMLSLLNSFTSGQPISFPALNQGSGSTRTMRTATNSAPVVRAANYVNASFTALNADELIQAFDDITSQIVSQGSYPSMTGGGAPEFGGYLVFSDVLGEYMQFREFKGLWNNNEHFTGYVFASQIQVPGETRNTFITNFIEYQDGIPTVEEVNALIASNIAAGNLFATSETVFSNKVSYFADTDRNFLGSYFTAAGTPAPWPSGAVARVDMYVVTGSGVNTLTGGETDMMNVIFQVITALQPGDFQNIFSYGQYLVSRLNAGDQIVRWYIPAALIPMRSVAFDARTNRAIIAEGVPIRFIYTVGLQDNFSLLNITDLYRSVNQAPGGGYFFYTNRWRGLDGRTSAADLANTTVAFFQPSIDNPYYLQMIDTTIEPKNPLPSLSGTSSGHWRQRSFTDTVTGEEVQVQGLGNNGRLLVLPEPPPNPTLQVTKTFIIDGEVVPSTDSRLAAMLPNLTFEIRGTGSGGQTVFNQVFPFSEFVGGTLTLTDMPVGTYVITEDGGAIYGHLKTPLSPAIITLSYGSDPIVPRVFTANVINRYSAQASMSITNTFSPAGIEELISSLSIVIIGTDSTTHDEIYRMSAIFPDDFADEGRLNLTNLPLGDYIIHVSGGYVAGYTSTVDQYVVGTLEAGEHVDINLHHAYGPPLISPGDGLWVRKAFHGLDSSQINEANFPDFGVIIETPDGVEREFWGMPRAVLGYTDVDAGIFIPAEELIEGTFTITEVGYELPPGLGFEVATPGSLQVTILSGDIDTVNMVVIDNFYNLLPRPRLTINVAFDPPQVQSLAEKISFVVVGRDSVSGDEIYRNTIFFPYDFSGNSAVLEGLPPGVYEIEQKGGEAAGFTLVTPSQRWDGISLNYRDDETLNVTLSYTENPPVVLEAPAIRVSKVFHGLLLAEYPQDFEIVLIFPDNSEMTFDLASVTGAGGVLIENVTAGRTYRIDERNSAVAGFNMSVSGVTVGG